MLQLGKALPSPARSLTPRAAKISRPAPESSPMRILLALLTACVLLAACAKHEESAVLPMAEKSSAFEAKNPQERPPRRLAYEHSVSVDTAEDKLQDLFASIQKQCAELSEEVCEVLESRVSSGRNPHASLKLRLKPGGVPKVISLLEQGGTVVEQSTVAEDLAAPMADADRHLAQKSDYRAKLEALRKQAGNDIDALIKIQRELSQVQSEIEVLTGTGAILRRRVDTEVINISLYSSRNRTFMKPVADSVSDFGANLAQGLASMITAIPYLIPWALVIVVFSGLARKIWSRRRRGSSGA